MKKLLYLIGLLISTNSLALTGNFSATVVPIDVASETVQEWLPEGVTLADDQSDMHKIVLMLGTQKNVAYFGAYREIIVVVPNAIYNGKRYMYFPRLFLDNRQAVGWGRALYGFPKVFNDMTDESDFFDLVDSENGNALLTLDQHVGNSRVNQSSENFKGVLSLLSQPMLLNKGGNILCSEFIMYLEGEVVKPANITLNINDGFMSSMESLTEQLASINEVPFGAFRINHARWKVPNTGVSCR
jgi:hypothetical protein